jgi:exopolysaccharide biosynthesis WecB/TagA/CpsF family protein
MNRVKILNVQIDNLSLKALLEKLRHGGVVVTPNVDHLMRLQKDEQFYRIYQHADFRVCDSQILIYASRLLGTPIQEKISGSDLFPAFCEYYQYDEGIKVFWLGSSEGIPQRAKQNINAKIGREIIVGCHSPSYGFEKDEAECQRIIALINQSEANVLGVGVGSPKQEKWIFKYKNQLTHIKLFLAIGATIDFEAGKVKRSPRWISEAGLEWLYRLVNEPKRLWKRYILDDSPFFWFLCKQYFNLYRDPFLPIPDPGIDPSLHQGHPLD